MNVTTGLYRARGGWKWFRYFLLNHDSENMENHPQNYCGLPHPFVYNCRGTVTWNVYSSAAKCFLKTSKVFLWVSPGFSLINSQEKNLIKTFFYSVTIIHNGVDMPFRCSAFGKFAVNYNYRPVDKQEISTLPNFEFFSFPRIHSPNSNSLYLNK
jgi:hypothetical protein